MSRNQAVIVLSVSFLFLAGSIILTSSRGMGDSKITGASAMDDALPVAGNSLEAPGEVQGGEALISIPGMAIQGYCTDIDDYLLSCTSIPGTGEDSQTLWVHVLRSGVVKPQPIPVTGEGSSKRAYEFNGRAICRESGGYALVVTVSPVYAGSWKIEGVNVHIVSDDLLTADTLAAEFSKLPTASEDIHYRVCTETSSSLTYECAEYFTSQPVCDTSAPEPGVELIAWGCDPERRNFFTQFSHNLPTPDLSHLAVSNDMGKMSCVVLTGKNHSIYCSGTMSTLIGRVYFTYNQPGSELSDSWNIEVQACPPLPPEPISCGNFHDFTACTLNHCSWDGLVCQ